MSDSVFLLILLCGVIAGLKLVAEAWLKDKKREQRRRFYRVEYLKSDDWKLKTNIMTALLTQKGKVEEPSDAAAAGN
jgi:hypothetical protein